MNRTLQSLAAQPMVEHSRLLSYFPLLSFHTNDIPDRTRGIFSLMSVNNAAGSERIGMEIDECKVSVNRLSRMS